MIQSPPSPDATTPESLQQRLATCVPCQAACPIQTDVPGYIEAIREGDMDLAYAINRRDNVFPGVLGRVCHRPCEPACRHGREGLGRPVQICFLKRSASDVAANKQAPTPAPNNGKRICVIGSGPSGLTAANDLALAGCSVTVLEQFDVPGGMMAFGIPEFRLPRSVVQEDIQSILDLGVELRTGERIENKKTLKALQKEYDAVIVAGGCMLATPPQLPGEELDECWLGLDYMMKANQGQLASHSGEVVVIGGGFTAVDCARTALRLGAAKVTLVYRRTQKQLRVGPNEIRALEEEGVECRFLATPKAIEGEHAVERIHFETTAVDAAGNIILSTEPGFTLEASRVILAIGQVSEDWVSAKATRENLFITGDFRDGSGTVIEACAAGRKTARKILCKLDLPPKSPPLEEVIVPAHEWKRCLADNHIALQPVKAEPLQTRMHQHLEVEKGLSRDEAYEEARRCYLCQYRFEIDPDLCIYCLKCIDAAPVDCIHLTLDDPKEAEGRLHFKATKSSNQARSIVVDYDACVRCGDCVRVCPVDCISVKKISRNGPASS